MIRWLCLIAALWAHGAYADSYPALFDVSGVAANDVLNIRSQPNAQSDIIGSFAHDRKRLEVLRLSPDQRWGRVGLGEHAGWIAMRFAVPVAGDDPQQFPQQMHCFGTEPFWSLSMTPSGTTYDALDAPPEVLTPITAMTASNGYFVSLTNGAGTQRHLTIARQACNDGMSDREFGLRLQMFAQQAAGNDLRTGCCTLDGGN